MTTFGGPPPPENPRSVQVTQPHDDSLAVLQARRLAPRIAPNDHDREHAPTAFEASTPRTALIHACSSGRVLRRGVRGDLQAPPRCVCRPSVNDDEK